jgi:hypothetical protein
MLTWAALRTATLDEADAGWFGVAPPLVDRARASRLGRRMLARRLASHGAPVLFGTLPRSTPQSIAVSMWALWPSQRLRAIAWDLGAIALGPALRAVVRREAVLRVRSVLGEERYALALASAPNVATAADREHRVLSKSLASDETLGAAVRRLGFGEFLAFARALHPACAERVLVGEAPGSVPETKLAWLDASRVATHLAALPAANEGTIEHGAGGDH